MSELCKINLVERLTGLERAYHGLTDAIVFDEQLAGTRRYIVNQIAEIILSDDLDREIEHLPNRKSQATAGQTISEICNDLFGNTDYNCSWIESKKWLGEAIVAASSSVV